LNARLLGDWMRAGVTIVDPATTWIDTRVSLGRDVEIAPGTQLEGSTTVAAGARVGPGCLLRDTTVGEGATITQAVCRQAEIGPGAVVGPFAYLAPGTRIASGGPVADEPAAGPGAEARRAGGQGTVTSEGAQDA
jgi:bifunctional UDP-N-acetylglucosamine pyrophosphorylase/glucosamine-1-phosphate N-acetyltransferase